jgi:hypothetical protein
MLDKELFISDPDPTFDVSIQTGSEYYPLKLVSGDRKVRRVLDNGGAP